MKTRWPLSRIGDTASFVVRGESPIAGTTYRQIGVRWWGEGAYERETIDGSQTKYSQFFRAETGDLIFNKIWARHGAVAVVDSTLAGTYGASEFRTLQVKADDVHPRWFHWLAKWPDFWAACQEESRGSSGKNRIKPDRFLEIRVPLPPRCEQDRIVESIEAVADRMAEARRLRDAIDKERDEMLSTMAHGGTATDEDKERMGWSRVGLGDVMEPGATPCRVVPGKQYPSIGMYSFGRGAFHRPPLDGADLKATTLFQVKAGQFIYAKLCAFEGTFGFVPDGADGAFVSSEFPAFDCDPDRVSSVFLFCYFKAPHVWNELDKAIRGFGGRRFRLKPEHLLAYRLWLPPLDYQNAVVRVYRHVERLRETQTTVAKELEDVMPALVDRAFRGEL